MTMILDLPRDLVEEILSRIPLKCTRVVRLTCKKWNALWKRRNFMKMHMAKATAKREGESQMIMMMDYNLHLRSVFVNDVDNPSTELKGLWFGIRFPDKQGGSNLDILTAKTDKYLYALGNVNEEKKSYQTNRYVYALGYVNDEKKESCHSLKVLRFLDDNLVPNDPETHFLWYEIYDFESDLWTTLDVTPHWWISFCVRGISLKGNTYWCAQDRNNNIELEYHIICFDFTRERFGPLLPLPFTDGLDRYVYCVCLSCVKEEKLALLRQYDDAGFHGLEIWITTSIEAEKISWSKLLIRDTLPVDNKFFCNGSFFIDEEKKMAMAFNKNFRIIGEDGYFRKLKIGRSSNEKCWPLVCSYIPSLVQIKQIARGKRKRQSSLEEHRYDEKMSRLVALDKMIEEQ